MFKYIKEFINKKRNKNNIENIIFYPEAKNKIKIIIPIIYSIFLIFILFLLSLYNRFYIISLYFPKKIKFVITRDDKPSYCRVSLEEEPIGFKTDIINEIKKFIKNRSYKILVEDLDKIAINKKSDEQYIFFLRTTQINFEKDIQKKLAFSLPVIEVKKIYGIYNKEKNYDTLTSVINLKIGVFNNDLLKDFLFDLVKDKNQIVRIYDKNRVEEMLDKKEIDVFLYTKRKFFDLEIKDSYKKGFLMNENLKYLFIVKKNLIKIILTINKVIEILKKNSILKEILSYWEVLIPD